MYPRRNRSAQRGNNRQPDKDLSLDIEAENIQNEAGNEASLVANIVAGVSNEANIAAQSNDPMAHYSGNDLNRVDDGNDLNRHHANKNGLSHYYEDDLNRLDSRKTSKKGMSEKEAPNGQKAEKVLNLIEPLIKEEQDELIRNEEDILPGLAADNNSIRPRKKSNAPKKGKNQKPGKDLAGIEEFTNLIGEDDIAHADEDMIPAKGLNFEAQNLPARNNKPGTMRRFFSRMAYYGGKSFGSLFGLIGKLLGLPYTVVRYIQLASRRSKNKKQAQDRDRTQDSKGNTGHTGIGIEFSRYSKTSGEWERYNLRYGFYPAGGLNTTSTQAVLGYHKAVIPGQLLNEKGNSYNISRSYPATPKQVNAVMNASVPYADKGYNNYTRNCTSFAKAMLLNVAHIPGGEEIFARDEIQLNTSTNLKMFGASIASLHFKTGAESDLNKLITGDDIGYENFGNKRMSGEEYKNYKKSLSYWKRRPAKADSPNAVAQNIRRLQGKDTGVISKWINKDRKNIDIVDARDKLRAYGIQLKGMLEEIAPDSTNKNSAPEELSRILATLDDLGAPIAKSTNKNQAENFSRAELREMRSGLTEYIGNLNKLLFGYGTLGEELAQIIRQVISEQPKIVEEEVEEEDRSESSF